MTMDLILILEASISGISRKSANSPKVLTNSFYEHCVTEGTGVLPAMGSPPEESANEPKSLTVILSIDLIFFDGSVRVLDAYN